MWRSSKSIPFSQSSNKMDYQIEMLDFSCGFVIHQVQDYEGPVSCSLRSIVRGEEAGEIDLSAVVTEY